MTSPQLLLVDDDPDTGAIVRAFARRCAHALTHRADAASAWSALGSGRFDLVLLDVNLPGASGIDLLRRLRAGPTVPGQPVALFCQPRLVHDVAAGWTAGADYLVSKELLTAPGAWKARLDEVLAHARGRTEGSPFTPTYPACSAGGVERLDRLLTLPFFQGINPSLLEPVLRRAWRSASGGDPDDGFLAWMGQRQTAPGPAPCALTPDQVSRCLASLVDQAGCLFGGEVREAILGGLDVPDRSGQERTLG